MKTREYLLLAAVLTTSITAWGQTNRTAVGSTATNFNGTAISPTELVAPPISTNALQRPRAAHIRTSGVLPMIRRTKNPLQLINPLAPASYGGIPGSEMDNFVSGSPGGVALFRLEF
jgi:hypothetical protein